MSKEIGITVKKRENFSEWYTQCVLKAELVDYSGTKGAIVLRPYGYAIWERIQSYLDKRLKALGHKNAYFPALIPEAILMREAEHFKGFTPEVFWVERAGDEALGDRLALRPTSETIAYSTFTDWIRSWRDLPLLLNFWNSAFRAEIKSTKPLIRTSEFLWQEGHTVHATKEEADREVMRILRLYKRLMEEELAIPVLEGKKSEREKFVGALYTTTLEALMPDGRALQMGTSHNLGQNFSKAFGIRYLGQDGKMHYAWQTSWGVSWRLLGAVVMVHGDDKGLVIPPRIAPIQLVLIPIYYSQEQVRLMVKELKKIARELKRKGVRAHLDDRSEYTPGWKFHDWELKGVPLRLELGPRDLEKGQVVLVRRDDGSKFSVKRNKVVEESKRMLSDIQRSLFEKASHFLKESIHEAKDYEEFRSLLRSRGGFVRAPWCGDGECEAKIKEDTGADIRLIPFSESTEGRCILCGRGARALAYFAQAY